MLRIAVVDSTADARHRLITRLSRFIDSDLKESAYLPRISLKPLALQELKFHGAPDILIVGEEIVNRELTTVGEIRKQLVDTPLLVALPSTLENLTTIDHLASMGADDTFTDAIDAREFFRKIILLAKRQKKSKKGQLILVDSGKGGLGVTSLAAGLAESLLAGDRRVAVIDLDFETQDLSRFLQTRPFINENLQLLLDGNRPVSEEFVEQCLVPVWEGEKLFCMSPCAESEDLYDVNAGYSRIMLSILEVLDESFDSVVIDVGSARGALLRTLYRVADKIVVVVSNDPAALYASAERVFKLRSQLSPNAQLLIVENCFDRSGLNREALRREFSAAAGIEEREWFDGAIGRSSSASRWPGSGETLYSLGAENIKRSVRNLARALDLLPSEIENSKLSLRSLLARSVKAHKQISQISDAQSDSSQVIALGAANSQHRLIEHRLGAAALERLASDGIPHPKSGAEIEYQGLEDGAEQGVEVGTLFQRARVTG